MKFKQFLIISILGLLSASCDKYLDVELQNQMTIEEVFSKRNTTEQFLAQVYGYLQNEWAITNPEGDLAARSDEGTFSWISGLPWLNYNNGSQSISTAQYHNWEHNYKGIKQATIFMENVHMCEEISVEQRSVMKSEARFLRAFFYFQLIRKYGPVFIWGDHESDFTISPESIDRHPLDKNIDFLVSELDEAAHNLPLKITDQAWYGRVTKGAALALKSRFLLYMARPLFNGNALYQDVINIHGENLFPKVFKASKWDEAAKSAKDVINLNNYNLYVDKEETDQFRKAIKSYMGVYFEKWNDEIIWGRWENNMQGWNMRVVPPRILKTGFGGYCPSLKLVDTYPMSATGRYPVEGYTDAGEPIVDSKSGYENVGFVDDFVHPLDTFASFKAHKSITGRDARFYASVLANGMYWINTYHGKKQVTFHRGGTSPYVTSGDAVKVGFVWRRFTDPNNDLEQGQWGQLVWSYFRLAEVFLNYAEACNEKPQRDEKEALKYLNFLRERSGLNKLEEAYPEVLGNQSLLRTLIRNERMVELAFEGHRFYDIRTWMIAEKEFNGAYNTLDVSANNYEQSWNRTNKIFPGKMVFEPKNYLFPIYQKQLDEMVNITQNYGW